MPRRFKPRHNAKAVIKEPPANEAASGAPACLKTAWLNERWRVIDCRDSIQWILQRRAGHSNGMPRWDGNAHCRTRGGLLSNIEERCGKVDPAGQAIVEALPVRHQ